MITIITPVYNGARFIEACIHVVIDQCCAEAEHLIVDGGSTDGTVDIIKRYADQYAHIRWVSEQDRGQSDAMNKGIALARGEVIGFLNVDDDYEPDVLKRVLGLFTTLPNPSLLVGNCNVWDSKDRLLYVNKPKRLTLRALLLGPGVNPYPINPSAYFYHRSVHQKIGLYKIEEHYALDLDFLLRAVQITTAKYVNETWGNFRMVEGSKTVSDVQTEAGRRRSGAVLKRYRQCLPRWQRAPIGVGYQFFTLIATPVKYFAAHPDELPWRFRARLKQILGQDTERKP